MSYYVDEYAILETNTIIHATPVDPCAQCDSDTHHHTNEYIIHLLLAVRGQSYQLAQTYPTRVLRDTAFEAICDLVKHDSVLEED